MAGDEAHPRCERSGARSRSATIAPTVESSCGARCPTRRRDPLDSTCDHPGSGPGTEPPTSSAGRTALCSIPLAVNRLGRLAPRAHGRRLDHGEPRAGSYLVRAWLRPRSELQARQPRRPRLPRPLYRSFGSLSARGSVPGRYPPPRGEDTVRSRLARTVRSNQLSRALSPHGSSGRGRALVNAPTVGESLDQRQSAAADVVRSSRADLVLETAAFVDDFAANDPSSS